jgi:hypothetical protein
MSAGSTRSVLHKDADNAINCVVAGTKEWIFIDPEYADRIPMGPEANGEQELGGFSTIDVDNVNLDANPGFAKVPLKMAVLGPGDCVFVPWGHLHQVRSPPGWSVAFSILFGIIGDTVGHDDERSNVTVASCSQVGTSSDATSPRSLDNFALQWDYPGHGKMTMGNADLEVVRRHLIQLLEGGSREPAPDGGPTDSQLGGTAVDSMTTTHTTNKVHQQGMTPSAFLEAYIHLVFEDSDLTVSESKTPGSAAAVAVAAVASGEAQRFVDALMFKDNPQASAEIVAATETSFSRRLSISDVARATHTELRLLRGILGESIANTEQFEFALIDAVDVLGALQDALREYPNGLARSVFLRAYVKHTGGTEYTANRVFNSLGPNNSELLDLQEAIEIDAAKLILAPFFINDDHGHGVNLLSESEQASLLAAAQLLFLPSQPRSEL